MVDGNGESRRKFSASSGKQASKDGGRLQNNLGRAPTSSSAQRVISTSSSRSSLAVSSPKSSSTQVMGSLDSEYGPTPPTSSSGSIGFRTNIFRSGREKAGSIREEAENDVPETTLTALPAPGGETAASRGRARKGSNAKLTRKPSNKDRGAPSNSPTRGTSYESDSSEGQQDVRRGSVIGKVAQKAKLVLPSKRNQREAGGLKIATKSTPSSPSLQSSPAMEMASHEADYSSESSDDGRNDYKSIRSYKGKQDDRQSIRGSSRPQLAGAYNSSREKDLFGSVSPRDGNILDAESILSRNITAEMTAQNRGQASTTKPPPNVKRIEKIMDMSTLSLDEEKKTPDRPSSAKPTDGSNADKPKDAASGSSSGRMPSSRSNDSLSGISTQMHKSRSTEKILNRPAAPRSTSAIKLNSSASTLDGHVARAETAPFKQRRLPIYSPPIPDPEKAPKVESAPPSGMYWARPQTCGYDHSAFRAHTTSLVGSNIFVFGGCDAKSCFNTLYAFDADCLFWSQPRCTGEKPPPLRAMTTTAVGKKLVIFGGGDGPTYYNDLYVLDTVNFRFRKPKINGILPSKRRAHTACLYKNGIFIFGGGDGVRALNDVWRLDASDLSRPSWRQVSAPTTAKSGNSGRDARPTARGYHTANMVGSKLIIFGGSDGVECFRDVWIFDVEANVWKTVDIGGLSFPRLSHTATVVGSYLFVIGGHDGVNYCDDVLLLNLVTMQWDRRKVYGVPPSGRGYHGTVLYDSRLFIIGGFDGQTVFDDTFYLELGVSAYYSQISHFTIDV
ncbi:MAG: hypothetical protein M1819_001598 [Sarea resinae]|nr:MAG: hypothetical protein M1819_001598 [Sarea resinae]